jgi:hypothetical protein
MPSLPRAVGSLPALACSPPVGSNSTATVMLHAAPDYAFCSFGCQTPDIYVFSSFMKRCNKDHLQPPLTRIRDGPR